MTFFPVLYGDAFIGPENNSISITETIDGLISTQ
jgi:hypothetical protein